jgi:hypothetical protein
MCRVQQLMQEINKVRIKHAKEETARLKVSCCTLCECAAASHSSSTRHII